MYMSQVRYTQCISAPRALPPRFVLRSMGWVGGVAEHHVGDHSWLPEGWPVQPFKPKTVVSNLKKLPNTTATASSGVGEASA